MLQLNLIYNLNDFIKCKDCKWEYERYLEFEGRKCQNIFLI
ncbi:unnamed protein product [Paramecium octaurelia]|uniref:Uncharacterized protein n=1 Tax=Paramecium octaurelia TaxID=43137 RepID=A0A8S1W794_PAROT|nr:unnamed protein product [Paramecium octaurelia]